MTNEYFHQTATATFLTTPHRTRVIVAKLVAGVLLATGFWLVTTAINVESGRWTSPSHGYGFPFTDPSILRSRFHEFARVRDLGRARHRVSESLSRTNSGQPSPPPRCTGSAGPVAVLLFGIIRQFVIHDDRGMAIRRSPSGRGRRSSWSPPNSCSSRSTPTGHRGGSALSSWSGTG